MSSTEISSPRRALGRPSASALPASLGAGVLRDAALVAGAVLAYFAIRNLTAGSADDAFANGERLVDLERWLGVNWEGAVQGAIVGRDGLVTIANWIYIWGHWPVILSAAAGLYIWRRDRYYLLRNTLFISGGIGFLFFALVPVAPPRLLEPALVDTVSSQSHAYRALQPPGLTNQYAALPSLHVGWNLAVGIVLFLTTSHLAVRALAALSPVAMTFAVLATANHFVMDVAAGMTVVLVAFAVALAIEQRKSETVATLAPDGPATRRWTAVPGRTPRRESPRRPAPHRAPRAEPCRS